MTTISAWARVRTAPIAWVAIAMSLGAPSNMLAQERPLVRLALEAGRPLRVVVAERIRVKHVGQPVTGTLADPVYAYDRMVFPTGTKVLGHIDKLHGVSRGTRLRAFLSGDFAPPRRVVVRFDSLVKNDGSEVKIETVVTSAMEQVTLEEEDTGTPKDAPTAIANAQEPKVTSMKRPGKRERLKYGFIARLPFHPQYLPPGTVYAATLQSPVDLGEVAPPELAPVGTAPPPDSVLHARLVTPLSSAHSHRGHAVEAVLTRPLFTADNQLILPEGTRFKGEVTFAKAARSFRRNGQLRFLFEKVQAPERADESLRASLHSVEAAQGDRLVLDDEGGASIANSKARFVAPAFASIAFGLTATKGLDYHTDGGPPEVSKGLAHTNSAGGFVGMGFLGVGLAQVSKPFSVAVGAVGVARSVYSSILGKGRDVSFPEGTVISVRLAPASDVAK